MLNSTLPLQSPTPKSSTRARVYPALAAVLRSNPHAEYGVQQPIEERVPGSKICQEYAPEQPGFPNLGRRYRSTRYTTSAKEDTLEAGKFNPLTTAILPHTNFKWHAPKNVGTVILLLEK